MDAVQRGRAVLSAMSTAAMLGLAADDATILHDSNKLAVHLMPCDVLARVAPITQQVARFELDLARHLTEAACPVGVPDPRVEARVYERDDFAITLWTYYHPSTRSVDPAEYANALAQLHAGMRTLDLPTPQFTERVDHARQLLATPDSTPLLADADRALLDDTLAVRSRAVAQHDQQLLHGEPHPGNVLATTGGLLFVDLETCCRGPVEFDLAHAPEEVSGHYPDVDDELLHDCRMLVLAMITTWRWDRDDQFPRGHTVGTQWLEELRAALGG